MTSDGTELKHLVDGIRVAMLTSRTGHGLCGRPLAVQRVEEDGTVWFLVDRDADWMAADLGAVNLAFVDDDTWVSAAGGARRVDDASTLEDLGDPISGAWFKEGVAPAALRVEVTHADYWTAPGRFHQMLNLAGALATDHQPDMGDRGVVEP